MNKKMLIPLALAIVLGLAAAFMARSMYSGNSVKTEIQIVTEEAKRTTVVVAKATLPPGKMLTTEDLTAGEIAGAERPEGAFTDPNQLVGRVVRAQLIRGQPLMENLLAPVGSGSGLQALVPPGMRAITIDINEVTGLSGMLTPGCRVDILSTLDDENQKPQRAKVILENIKVQAVGTAVADAPAPAAGEERQAPAMARTVTMLTTPEQATMIELAGTVGRLRLVLRANGDESPGMTTGVTLAALKGDGLASGGESAREVGQFRAIDRSTTQPSDRPTSLKRAVTIIRGGVETTAIVEEPVPATSDESPIMTGTDQTPF